MSLSKQFLTFRRLILLTFSRACSSKRLSDCEDGDSMILQNVSDYLSQDKALYSEVYNLTLINMRTSKAKSWLRQLLASCHEGPGTLQGQYMWQTDWHCERFSSEYFGFPLSVLFHIHSIIHH